MFSPTPRAMSVPSRGLRGSDALGVVRKAFIDYMKSSENIKDKFKDFIDSRLQLQINDKSYNTQSQALN